MKIGSIVYSKQYGFGKIVEFKDNYAVTMFLNEQRKLILKTFLEVVDEKLVSFMLEHKYLGDFDGRVLNRALEYNNNYNIISVFYHDNTIKAEINGTDEYYTSIVFKDGKCKYSCTCPIGNKKCKHSAALCMYMENIFRELSELTAEKRESNVELSENIKSVTDNYVLSRSGVSALLYDILKDVEEHLSIDYIVKYFKYISKIPSYKANMINVYRIFGFNDKIRAVLMDNLSSINRFVFYSEIKSAIGLGTRLYSEARLNSSRIDEYNVDYYFYNYLYEQFIICYFNQKSYYFRYESLLPIAIELTEITSNLFNALKRYLIDGKRIDSEGIRMLVARLSLEQKVDLYTDNKVALKPTYGQIAQFPEELKIKLIPSIAIVNSEIPMILDELRNMEIPDQQLAKILCNLRDSSSSEINVKKIGELAKDLENGELFYRYLTNNQTSTRGVSYYTFNYKPLDESAKLADYKQLDEYFTFSYNIDEQIDDYSIRVYLLSLTNRTVFSASINNKDEYRCTSNEIDGDTNSLNVNKYINYIIDSAKDFAENLNVVRERIRKSKLKSQYAQLSYDMETIKQKFSNATIQLSNSRKAHLQYNFRLGTSSVNLSFKVGIDKMYIVKNVYSFLDHFKQGVTEKYGKSLVLTHKINNFETPDDEILKLLTMFKFERDYYGDSKELNLGGSLFYRILTLLKGKTIEISDTTYYVSLKKIDPEIFIDNDYVIKYSLANDKYKSYFFDGHILVFDQENHTINTVECSSKDYELYNFVNKNNGAEIKDVVDVFKDEIYARYADKIVVAEKLKDDFKLSILSIDSYFDYDNKMILLDTKYRKNDVEVLEEELTKSDDLNKVALYKQYMQSIGFEDNQLKDDANVLSFFSMDLSEMKDYCSVFLSESIKNKQIIAFKPSLIRINYQDNIMSAILEQSEFSDEELDQIIRAIRKKKKYVQLTGDRIIDISDDSSKQFVQAVEDVGLDSKHLSESKQISVVNALKGYAHNDNVSVDSYLSDMVDDIKGFKKNDMPVVQINGDLRDYQKDGYRWMKILSDYHVGGILADDMGLGKTIQIICLIKGDDNEKPNLIVCPKSLVFNWKNEFAKFANEENVVEIYGSKDERLNLISNIDANKKCTYITSYDSLRNDLEDYKVDFNYLVIDEAQYIKNVFAQKTMSVKQLKAAHKFALTGTPIENNIIDLWSIFDFIMPGYLEQLNVFKSNYANDEEFVDLVRRRVAPFILRRTKAAVLKDFPEKYERVLTAEMTTDQKKLYDALAKQARDAMRANKGAFGVLPYLMRLRQICVDPHTFIDSYDGKSGKMELLKETVIDYVNGGHKILIFSQFVKALNLVETILKENNIGYFMITGETDAKQRIKIADKFNGECDEKVCLISLKAGGTGLNLIGADTVIHLDPWWNVSAENQATDRTYRIGQTKSVEVIKLICANSIEQRVIERQNIKKFIIDQLISDDDSSVSNITLEDIEFILSD